MIKQQHRAFRDIHLIVFNFSESEALHIMLTHYFHCLLACQKTKEICHQALKTMD